MRNKLTLLILSLGIATVGCHSIRADGEGYYSIECSGTLIQIVGYRWCLCADSLLDEPYYVPIYGLSCGLWGFGSDLLYGCGIGGILGMPVGKTYALTIAPILLGSTSHINYGLSVALVGSSGTNRGVEVGLLRAARNNGLMIGVITFSQPTKGYGVQVGLLNFSDDGWFPLLMITKPRINAQAPSEELTKWTFI